MELHAQVCGSCNNGKFWHRAALSFLLILVSDPHRPTEGHYVPLRIVGRFRASVSEVTIGCTSDVRTA